MNRVSSTLVAAAFCVCVCVCSANPTDKNPGKAMAAHGAIDTAKEKTAELYSMYNKYEELAIRSDAVKSNTAKLPYRELGRASGELWQSTRDVEDLALMGEPAATDLRFKMMMLRTRVAQLALNSAASANGGKHTRSIIDKLKKQTPKRDRDLAKLAENIQKGQLDVAESSAKRMGTDLYSQVVFISPSGRKPFIQKFDGLVGELNNALKPKRRQAYQQQAMQKLAANSKLISGFATEIKRVSAELAAKGTVTINQAEGSHADAIRHLCNQWGAASSALMRNMALQWAFGRGKPSEASEAAAKQAASIATAARAAIANVVKAAASSTPEDKVDVVYGEILQSLSFADRRAAGNDVSKDCEAALSALVAKSPSFRSKVEAYRQATTDALKWRETFAQVQADSFTSSYPSASSVLTSTAEIKTSNKPAVFGSASARKRVIAPTTISQPANWSVFEAGSVLSSRRVSETNSLRLYEGSKTAVVSYYDSHYSNVRVDMPIEKQLRDLTRILYVDEEHPPLTIEAANAMSSANWQDFEQVGGSISEVHLEGVVTRFASLPSIVYTINPLGVLPDIADNTPVLEQACWRLNIEPHWARHKYFTVTIPQRIQVGTQ